MTIIAGTLLDNAGAIYNVKNSDFAGGAKGDGITDDHAAITAAIAAATATGGVVYFPPGTYLVSQKLDGVPGKRNVLVGANRDSCIIKRTSGTGGVLDWKTVGFNHLVAEFSCRVEELTFDGSNNTGVVVDIQDLSLMRMCRVNITGNGLAGPAANCIGLRLSSMWDCHFEDIYVTSCGGTGVNGACVLLDTRVIASDSLNNCQFHNLHIEPGPCDAILLQFAANSSSEIGDNYFFGLKTHGNLATGQPNNPLVKMSQFARANAFFGHVIAFGNSATLGQIECDGQRNVWYSPTIGISGGGPATDPAYAFRFTGNAVG